MSAALLGNWSLFGVLAIAFFARLADELGSKAMAMGPAAVAGIGMFVVSSVLMNAWMLTDTLAEQLFLWRYGLLTDAVLYAAVYLWALKGQTIDALSALAVAVGLHSIVVSNAEIETKQIAEFLQIALIALLSWLCLRRVRNGDVIALLFWGVLAINEIMSAFWVGNCQYIKLGIRDAGSACEQIYGFDVTQIVAVLSMAYCGWILFRWFKPRAS